MVLIRKATRLSGQKNNIIVLLFISVGFMPFVPSGTSVPSVIFAIVFLWSAIFLLFSRRGKIKFDIFSTAILTFIFGYLPISALIALINNHNPNEVVRGVIPFLFIFTYILAIQLDSKQLEKVPKYILIMSSAWAIQIIFFNPTAIIDVARGSVARLTYDVAVLLVPIGLVGYVTCLYYEGKHNKRVVILAIIFLTLIVLSGYRSQLGLAIAATLFRFRNIGSYKSIAAISFLIIAASLFVSFNPNYLDMMITRFQYSSGDDVRSAERAFAYTVFLSNPLFGDGVAVPVPITVTRPEGIFELFSKDHVNYIHNFVGYIAMNFGIVGLSFFGFYFLAPLVASVHAYLHYKRRYHIEYVIVLLGVILVYFQISASFRQIQMWIIISFVLAFLSSLKRKRMQ